MPDKLGEEMPVDPGEQPGAGESAVDALSEEIRGFDLQEAINSARFIEAIRAVPLETRENAVGWAIEYCLLHPDGFKFWEFVEKLSRPDMRRRESTGAMGNVFKLLVQSMVEKVELGAQENPPSPAIADGIPLNRRSFHERLRERGLDARCSANVAYSERARTLAKEVVEFCIERVVRNGKVFHGFNGVFEPSIRENGLTCGTRPWDWDEVKRIGERVQQVTGRDALGWAKITAIGTVCYDTHGEYTYGYAVHSPEWFYLLLAEISSEHPDRSTAFARRDHELARALVVKWIQEKTDQKERRPLTPAEGVEILAFFDKHWAMFTGPQSRPKVALIRRGAVIPAGSGFTPDGFSEDMLYRSLGRDPNIYEVVGRIYPSDYMKDCVHKADISPTDIQIIDLPEYSAFF